MTRNVLITDSLFIFDEHIAQLKAAGLNPVRLDKVKAGEAELVEAIKGCEGYILGGIEDVSAAVIEAATQLKAVCFTGADYAAFISAHALATQKGIAITNCPGANATAVSEFTLSLLLTMLRHVPQLSMKDGKNFYIAQDFADTAVGIVGYGYIGRAVAQRLKALGFRVIVATRGAAAKAAADGFKVVPLGDLVTSCDAITVHVDTKSGAGLIDAAMTAQLKNGCIVVNTCNENVFDVPTLLARVAKGELYFAGDHVDLQPPAGCPVGQFIKTNASTAYNTQRANKVGSDMATQSLINLLSGKDDQYVVNPEYKKNAKAA